MFLTEKVFINGNQSVLNRFSTSGFNPPRPGSRTRPRLGPVTTRTEDVRDGCKIMISSLVMGVFTKLS